MACFHHAVLREGLLRMVGRSNLVVAQPPRDLLSREPISEHIFVDWWMSLVSGQLDDCYLTLA